MSTRAFLACLLLAVSFGCASPAGVRRVSVTRSPIANHLTLSISLEADRPIQVEFQAGEGVASMGAQVVDKEVVIRWSSDDGRKYERRVQRSEVASMAKPSWFLGSDGSAHGSHPLSCCRWY